MRLLSEVIPIDVKIFYENKIPYLDYVGVVNTDIGKLQIHIPKMGLNISEINSEVDDEYVGKIKIRNISRNLFITDDKWYDLEILEREMTKQQIENELGYKIIIK